MTSRPVALVTGSSRGIGRAIVEDLAAHDFAVVINFVSSRETATAFRATIEASGAEALAVQGNVADAADRARLLAETLARFGRLDLLVNNAGIPSPGRKDLLEATEENWDLVFATNLKGPFFLSQLVAKSMIEQIQAGRIAHGKIVNISSISSYTASVNRADYCLSKAALPMMTWLLADRLAEEKITVFEVAPGVIATDMTGPVQAKYDRLIGEGLTPQRRWGQPSDVAKAVTAIALDYFPFSTGTRIDVDGGFHIRRL